jgi:predicted Zn-dependent peptidase
MKKINVKLLLSLLLLVLVSFTSRGQGIRIDFTEYTLDNGLHVILHQDNTTPNVVVNIMYHVGAKMKTPSAPALPTFSNTSCSKAPSTSDAASLQKLLKKRVEL